MKRNYEKSKFLELLGENPWVSFASKKSGISRATIYRWMKDSPDFRHAVDEAIKAGNSQLGEMAEMSLVKNIRDGNLNAVKYYLDHNNPKYIKKIQPYSSPPIVHDHSSGTDTCELCIRAETERKAQDKMIERKINTALEKLLNPETEEEKKEADKILNRVMEIGREHGERRKD
jgi:predicted Fe-S protein YdhL (DUF1289 family)